MKIDKTLMVDDTDVVTNPIYTDADIFLVPTDDRENQRSQLLDMASSPLERCLLEQLRWFHREVEMNLNRATRESGGAAKELHYDRAAKFSRCSVRIAETVLKQRGRGEQKMVVESPTATGSGPQLRGQTDLRKPAERRSRSAARGTAS